MNVDRTLRIYSHRAAALLRSSSAAERDTGAAALMHLGRISLTLSTDPKLVNFARDLLAVAHLLPRAPQIIEAPVVRRYSDDELIAALRNTKTIADAARRLGCDYRTLTRRKRKLGHKLALPYANGVRSPRQSTTQRKPAQ